MYVEARMRTTETFMSGTFWLMMPKSDCSVKPKKELDITESIGRRTNTFLRNDEGKVPDWHRPAVVDFLNGMNSNARERDTNCNGNKGKHRPGHFGGEKNPSNGFHNYGFYWKSPTKLYFYFDGKYQGSIKPTIPYKDPMAIVMAIESYDFNLPSGDDVVDGFKLANGSSRSLQSRSTRYQWVRTWQVDTSRSKIDASNTNLGEEFDSIIKTTQDTTGDILNIEGLSGIKNVDIYNMYGLKVVSTSTSGVLNIENLAPGIYVLAVDGIKTTKFFKK